MKKTTQPTVVSRHSFGAGYLWNVEAYKTNIWCRLPGSLFSPIVLAPNHPRSEQVSVMYGTFEVPDDFDSLTFFLNLQAGKEHRNAVSLDISLKEDSGKLLRHANINLSHGREEVITLAFDPKRHQKIIFEFKVAYTTFLDTDVPCQAFIDHILSYKNNILNDLFNSVGSDKGTEIRFEGGAPHCYAIDYYHLFEDLKDQEFNFLEIGLDNASKQNGSPQDAPSLRAWREFFPKATIFGFDINDFSFFKQERTFTFHGDQSSPQDLHKFIETFQGPQFKVVVDDGSHASSHQQISLATLLPHVAPLGLYVIEDLSWQPFEESPKTLDLLRKFIETGKFESRFISKEESNYLEEAIEKVEIYKPNDSAFAVIYKKLIPESIDKEAMNYGLTNQSKDLP